jgi:soluble lytic murein transglycosylase-like protein
MNRYYGTYQGTITNAANSNGIDPSLLASIGIRESGLQNIAQSGGMGRGVFQVDLGADPNVSTAQAFDANFSANFAANMLGTATQALQGQGYSAQMGTAGAVRQYNAGTRYLNSKMKQGIAGLDRGTTGNNYVSNVLAIQGSRF